MSVAKDFYSLWDENAANKQRVVNGATTSSAPVVLSGDAHPYAAAALQGEALEVSNAREGSRNHTLNRSWFRMGKHIGAGTIDRELVRSTLADAALMSGLPQHEVDTVLRDNPNGGAEQGALDPRRPTELEAPAVTVFEVPDLEPKVEDDFWASRELLTHLHTFARARMVSPWAVLGVALARVVTATPNQVCLPPIVGGKQSLNMFVGLVGRSGSGKGAAEAVAAEALDVGPIVSHNVGSGEGIAHGYKRRVKQDLEWIDDDHAVLFSVPEIDSLAAQGDRKGATLMPQLRSGWTGEQLGFGYADPTKRIIVEAHKYRLCLVAGIQPGRAGCLIDDADGGTPQRFLWMPATDPTAPDTEPEAPKPITWNAPRVGPFVSIGGIQIQVCQTAVDVIKESRRARNRGDGDALDGHALLCQLKTAAALGIADGRYTVTDEDWNLAAVIAHKSAATRGEVVKTLAAKAAESNHAKAQAEAKRAVHVAETTADAAVKRVCNGLLRKLRKTPDGLTNSGLRRAVGSKDRAYYEDALERLVGAGQIQVDETVKGSRITAQSEGTA